MSNVSLIALVTKTSGAERWLATTVLPASEFIKHNTEGKTVDAKYPENNYIASAYCKNGKAYLKHESMYDVAELWKLM